MWFEETVINTLIIARSQETKISLVLETWQFGEKISGNFSVPSEADIPSGMSLIIERDMAHLPGSSRAAWSAAMYGVQIRVVGYVSDCSESQIYDALDNVPITPASNLNTLSSEPSEFSITRISHGPSHRDRDWRLMIDVINWLRSPYFFARGTSSTPSIIHYTKK